MAVSSGNLRVGEREHGADVVLAAAMQRHALGATLLRLQSEYDGTRADLERAGEIAKRGEAGACALDRLDTEKSIGMAAALRKRTEAEALTARCLILTHLKTLRSAKDALGAYAIVAATKRGFMGPDDEVLRLADRVLDVWLDPTCALCDGTGWVGSGYQGRVSKRCDRCGGTGHRRDQMANDDRRRWFAFLLLGDVQREVAFAASGMQKKLRAV